MYASEVEQIENAIAVSLFFLSPCRWSQTMVLFFLSITFCRIFILFLISRIIYLAFSVLRWRCVHVSTICHSNCNLKWCEASKPYAVCDSMVVSVLNTFRSEDIIEKYDSNIDKCVICGILHRPSPINDYS